LLFADPLDVVGTKAEILDHRLEVVTVAPVEVDPQELALAQVVGDAGLEVDRPVAPVGVEQPGVEAAQRKPRSAAPRTAINAMPYCRTCMARSPRRDGSRVAVAGASWVVIRCASSRG
jgi:hypothetical protein